MKRLVWFGTNTDGHRCDICEKVADSIMRLDVDVDNAAMYHICPKCIYNYVKTAQKSLGELK